MVLVHIEVALDLRGRRFGRLGSVLGRIGVLLGRGSRALGRVGEGLDVVQLLRDRVASDVLGEEANERRRDGGLYWGSSLMNSSIAWCSKRVT